jgi:aryl-alcohol dehydrogenase-like predicted oxidoreductase
LYSFISSETAVASGEEIVDLDDTDMKAFSAVIVGVVPFLGALSGVFCFSDEPKISTVYVTQRQIGQDGSWSMGMRPPRPLGQEQSVTGRRAMLLSAGAGGLFSGMFGGGSKGVSAKSLPEYGKDIKSYGPTNEVIKTVNGIKHRRLGGSNIVVSELGLGTQRWCSTDFNAPGKEDCFGFMDEAILKGGVNLLDTAEQYPIPSDGMTASEGNTEKCIGEWMQTRKVPRNKVVIATKITGGRNITPANIIKDCEGSLKRLQTDYIDVYQLHWPQHYSPQSNWGQSLKYNVEDDESSFWRGGGGPTSYEDMCLGMEKLVQQGKIRGWGLCNDNAYGLTACTRTAKMLGTTPPCSFQGDFSMIDRKVRLCLSYLS